MQTASYTVNSGSGVAFWRGIPAQITIAGIEDVSGDWLFLVDNDNTDGVILSGTVAASGNMLVVTLENMNTEELAKVIKGQPNLLCRATLTDGISRVYIIPLFIRNCAVEGAPTPVAEYYDKATIDAMIAAIPAGTDDYTELTNKPAINGHTLTGDQTAADLGLATPSDIPAVPVQSVNGQTGAVELTASDVGAFSLDGGDLSGNVTIVRTALPRPQIQLIFNGNVGFSVNNNKLLLGGSNSGSETYGAVAIGYQNSASGGYGCMTLGRGLTNAVNSSLVAGEYNAADDDAILTLGNGTSTSARSNAFVVKKTGDALLSGDLTFTPTGKTATTLSALIARIEALEQAQA